MKTSSLVRMRVAQKLLWRDWKSGELNILLASLLLAVATVTSISLFTSRIHNSINEEASHFLAADAKISGSQIIPNNWRDEALEAGIQTAHITRFRAMTFFNDEMTLTQVKAVSDNYPLKGELSISDQPYQASTQVAHGPRPGEAWLAPRLFGVLGVQPGDKVSIGDADFTVSASLNKEPDSGQSLFGVSPRVMINIEDVERTRSVQVGSRVGYDLLLKADDQYIANFKALVESQLGEHFRWTGIESENRGIGSALSRAERFLLLTGCLSVVLSGVAIALAARRYAKRQHNQVAILKTLGTSPRNILGLYSLHILLIGLLSLIIGAFLGWFLHWGIITALGSLIPTELAAPSLTAYSTGAITGFIALWAFAAPPIFSLHQVLPASILREEKDQTLSAGWSGGIGALAILVLMFFYSRDIQLTLIVAAGVSACLLGVGSLSAILILLTKKIGKKLSYTWRLGLSNLQRHQRFNALQIMIFSVLLMLLFILLTVRTTLIGQWQQQLPENTPNHFAFNIFPEETDAIKRFFDEQSILPNPFYPMTRGRVIKVNDKETSEILKDSDSGINYVRELNLTWSLTPGEDNQIIAGEWWDDQTETSGELLVSAEEDYAAGLGITIGDSIEFSVAGEKITARVSSIRSVQWDSMNPNFYMIFNQAILNGVGANWITSFYLTPEQKPFLNKLSRSFPTVSLVELDQTIGQIQSIISKVSMAIEFILFLVLASGFLVLITSIQATLDVRFQESAIFRTLGANRKLVRKTLLIEFCTLGWLAGLLATFGTELCMYFLQTRVFSLDYTSQPLLWVWGPLLSALLIGTIGWTSTRSVTNTPPLNVLRAI
ncbi:ABC transporter permease [Agarilytica rhodophyticola]|uniref:ABC transporter permease n=1 Tax=Agarilytica rhodophyticola TaxID=1737490 RepID=UPI001FEB4E51|nr:FtsX-like permease family protein [Agarilytica rhodophyticola]